MKKIVEVKKLNVAYNKFSVLKDINCSFYYDSGIIGLIGPNGAGKTTLIHAIVAQEKIKSGIISCNLNEIAYCPDTPEFDDYVTAYEILLLSLKLRGMSYKREEVDVVLKRVGLFEYKYQFANNFSRGMKQRLGIAAAIVLKPKLLFLDEPTSALDPIGKENMLELISDLSKEMTIVISSHLLEDIQKIADRLLVINEGKIIFEGMTLDFIKNNTDYGIVTLKSENFKEKIKLELSKEGVTIIDDNIICELSFFQKDLSQILYILSKYSEGIKKISVEEYSLESAFNHILKSNKEDSLCILK